MLLLSNTEASLQLAESCDQFWERPFSEGSHTKRMIARVWHGVAPESRAGEHLKYIQEELFRAYREAPGYQGAILLSRKRTDCTEFLLLSLWESASFLESMTGPDVEGAMARELVNPSPMVKNYEVVVAHLPNQR